MYALFARFASRLSGRGAGSSLRRAEQDLAHRSYVSAAAGFREVLEQDPAAAAAHAGLVKALSALRDWPAAVLAAQEFVERAPGRPSAKRFLARALAQTGRLDAAERLLEDVLAANGGDQTARLELGRIALRRDQCEQALLHVAFAPANERIAMQRCLLRGKSLVRLSRLAEAASEFEVAHDLDPRRGEVLQHLVDISDQLGRSVDLERWLRALHALQPSDVSVCVRLARMLLDRGVLDEAEATLAEALKRTVADRQALDVWAAVLAARLRRRRELGEPVEGGLFEHLQREALAQARHIGLHDPSENVSEREVSGRLKGETLAEARRIGVETIRARAVDRDMAALLRMEALAEARRAGIGEAEDPAQQVQEDIATVLRMEAREEARRAGLTTDGPSVDRYVAGGSGMEALAEAQRAGIVEGANSQAVPAQQSQLELATALRLEALEEARRAGLVDKAVASPRPDDSGPAPSQNMMAALRLEALAEARRSGVAERGVLAAAAEREAAQDMAMLLRLEALAEARKAGIDLKTNSTGCDDATGAALNGRGLEVMREGTPEWLADQAAEATYAFRTDAFLEVVDIVERLVAYDRSNPTMLEMGGFAANRVANWRAAARFWKELSLLQENRRGPRLQHATALMESGNTGAALGVIDPLLATDPQSADLIRLKLSILTRGKDYPALDRFDAELATQPWSKADATLLETIGAGFLAADHVVTARRWLERARALDPQNTAALRLQARIAYTERQYDHAVTLCQELEQTGAPQQRLEARMIRARVAHLRGNVAEATIHYEKVVADAPSNVEAVTYIVRRHLAARHILQAEEHIAGVPRHGNEGTHHWWQALLLQAKGKGDEAAGYLLKALDASPSDMAFRHRVIEFMLETERLEEALSVVCSGLELEPTSPRLRSRLLQCRMRMECPPQEIVEICDETLDLSPRDEEALLQRGNANARLGNRRSAIADFRAGLTAFPRNTTFWRSALSSLLLLGEEVEAKALLDEARAIFAANTAADLAALADIFDAADLQDEALAFAKAAVQIDGDSDSRQLLARIQVQRGRLDLAWPHLLQLHSHEQRHIRTTRLYAQVAAGRAAALPWEGAEPADRSFPQAVFDAIATRQVVAAGERRQAGRLRVLHVTSTLGAGGAERQLANTVVHLAHLRGAGVEVELAVEDLNPAHGRDFFLPPIRSTGIPVYSLDEERQAANWRDMLAARPEMRGAVQAIASLPIEIVRNALPLLPILLERQPDVVQLWQDSVCIASGIAAALAGVPRILLCTRSTRPVERQRARRYLEPGFRALLRRPGVSLLNNSLNGARDYEDWLGMAKGSVEVVYNGYDFSAIRGRVNDARSRRIREDLGIPFDAPVLGGVMRCSFEKRPELWTEAAIELCRTMPGAYGLLVGDGPMMGEIKARVADCGLGDRIHYVGTQSPVEPWMRAMDVLFLSSLTEGLPNVLIEAQSIGVPVATMRIGGAPETVVENETAVVIDEGPIAAIARPIRDLLADPPRRHGYGERAVAWTAGQFGIEATVDKLLECYRANR